METAWVLVVGVRGAHPLRVSIAKRITSLGSDPAADVCQCAADATTAEELMKCPKK